MPQLSRQLSVEESALVLNKIEVVEAAFAKSEDAQEELEQAFTPHAYQVKGTSGRRKEEQRSHQLWKETIFKRHMDLQVSRQKLQRLATKVQQQNNSPFGFSI